MNLLKIAFATIAICLFSAYAQTAHPSSNQNTLSHTDNLPINAAAQPGSDVGAQVNSALSLAAPSWAVPSPSTNGYGKVTIPPGNYTFSTPITLTNYPNVTLDCQGANLTYTGTGIAIDALRTDKNGTISQGGIENCNLYAPAAAIANVTAFRFGNTNNYKFLHNTAWNFDASGDIGLLMENTVYFTEASVVDGNFMHQDTVGYEMQNNCGGVPTCTESFEYTFFRNNGYSSPYKAVDGPVGLLLTGGANLQNSIVDLHANINGPSGGVVLELSTSRDQLLRDQIAIQAEPDGTTTSKCVVNNGRAGFVNGTLVCDAMPSTGNPIVLFGSDGGSVGDEELNLGGHSVIIGSNFGASNNLLPDSEAIFNSTYWTPFDHALIGNSPANTGHTDFGFWNDGSAIICAKGHIKSEPFILPAGTYSISANEITKGTTTGGCSGSQKSFAIFAVGGTKPIAIQDSSRNEVVQQPQSFILATPTPIYVEFQYSNINFPTRSYLVWNSPQIEQGAYTTAYKQSIWGSSSPKLALSNSSTVLSRYASYTATFSPKNPGANTISEQILTVRGVQPGDKVISITPPSALSHVGIVGSRVIAANTVAVAFAGDAIGAAPPSGSYIFIVVQ
jgi:hypothetical protein